MSNWQTICDLEDIPPNVGICALVEDEQVAIFRCTRSSSLYAISNYDPIGKANVMSRGIIGSLGGEPVVASPLYKQHFNLTTGQCIENPDVAVYIYPVREQDGKVQIQSKECIAA